jgi:hypothetical protein
MDSIRTFKDINMEKKFTIQEITIYLNNQLNLDAAIRNIANLNNEFGAIRKTIKDRKGKIVLYIPYGVNTKGELKKLLIKYMEDNGHEKCGYEEVMKVQELLDSLEWRIE